MATTRIVNENGDGVKVTKDKGLFSFAVTETESQFELRKGNTFNINSGEITLTTTGQSAVFYLQNNGTEKLIVESIIFGVGKSTGSTKEDQMIGEIIRNPMSGTIVSNAVPAAIQGNSNDSNKNFGLTHALDVTSYKGVEGDTITDGADQAFLYLFPSQRTVVNEISIELESGNSLGINITPGVGNSTVKLYVALAVFVAEDVV